jgi:S-DNA-T family DNA segregation ATPase FtsK/SpoIIIE
MSWMTTVLPALAVLPLAALSFHGGHGTTLLLVLLLIPTLGGSVAVAVIQRRGRLRETARTRQRWLAHREALVEECRQAAEKQRGALDRLHPSAGQLADLVQGGGGFERRSQDSDALVLAIGTGSVPARVYVTRSPAPLADCDPDLALLAAAVVRETAGLDAAPVTVALGDVGVLAITGPPELATAVLRSLVAQLAALHPPSDLAIRGVVRLPTEWQSAAFETDGDAVAAWLAQPAEERRVAIIDGYQPGSCRTLDAALAETHVLAVVTCAEQLPARCGAVFDLARERLTVFPDQHHVDPETLSLPDFARVFEAIGAAAPSRETPAPDLRSLIGPGLAPLRVPVGVTPTGLPVFIDLREAAEGGDGPHGLLVGATGSGKSVALQTIVAGLAAGHPPEALSLLLIDFKGGAAFDRFAALPQVAGIVTNLEDESTLLDRVRISLEAEMERRQRSLRAGHAPLSALVIVIDEAGELLTAVPEFADTLTRIGRIGRALGIHLLLATQRWEEGRFRALDAHLRLRLCLRTFTADDSRAVLGDDSATSLPARPGAGWLAVDRHRRRVDVLPAPLDLPVAPGSAVQPVWLPPLPHRLVRADLPDADASKSGAALPLALMVGVRDLPAARRQPPLVLDLDGPGGNLAVVGGPRSGVSTALRTIVTELCRDRGPAGITIHAIDLSSGLAEIDALPHVGTVTRASDNAAAQRVLHATHDELRARLGDPRRSVRPWVLVIDAVTALRGDDGAAESMLADVAARGLSVGIHLLLGARRWSELRQGTFDACGTRLELRLGDPSESIVSRARARELPVVAGRGLLPDGTMFQLVLPDTSAVAAAATERWPDVQVAPIRELPTVARAPDAAGDGAFPLGIGGSRHEPVLVELLAAGAHLSVTGDARSGRSTVLRRVLAYLRDAPVDIVVLDPRGSLAARSGQVGAPIRATLIEARTPEDIAAALDRVAAALDRSEPASVPATTTRPLIVIADDVDLVDAVLSASGRRAAMLPGTTPPRTTLQELAALLPWSADLGLHLVVAGPPGGVRIGLDSLGARLRAAAAGEVGLPGTFDAGLRRPIDRAPAGRARLTRVGESAIAVQCYL